jgi:uncharacterized protein YjeT (DUF2065 family)
VDTWSLIFAGLGIAMVVEGLPYFIAPAGARKYLRQLAELGNPALRILGFLLMAAGLLVAWLALG